jgi:hypothetical protein
LRRRIRELCTSNDPASEFDALALPVPRQQAMISTGWLVMSILTWLAIVYVVLRTVIRKKRR